MSIHFTETATSLDGDFCLSPRDGKKQRVVSDAGISITFQQKLGFLSERNLWNPNQQKQHNRPNGDKNEL